MTRLTRRLFGATLAALVVAMIAVSLLTAGPRIPERAALLLELEGDLEEVPPRDALAQLTARGPALPTLLLLLDMAAADARIRGVLVHLRSLDAGYAQIQELRNALVRAREAGKRVVSLLDVSSLNATREYYLASASDQIYVDPGYLGPIAGVAGQYLHLGGLFERLGVQWQYERVGDYKSAVELFSAREMSQPAREMTSAIIDGVFEQIVDGVAQGRKLEPARVSELIDQAPGTAEELVAAGLADGVADLEDVLKLAGLEGAKKVPAEDYRRVSPRSVGLRQGPQIALVFGDGAIAQSSSGPLARGFATDEIAQALKDAGEDEDIRAVVLRINSGGGSSLASEQLWREVMRVREKKPVVVSMGDAAASGGYYVASGANAIVAQPATLTGSIGVFFLRPALAGVYEKLEIGAEVIARGRHASVAGSDLPFTEEQRQRAAAYVQAIYREFLERVARGRGGDAEQIDRVGQGHVWLGRAALDLRLVDELGGLHEAVQRAKREAGLPADSDPERVVFPGARSLGDQLRELLRGELVSQLRAALLPFEPPEVLTWAWQSLDGDVAYLPTHWVEIE
jgi:protease-4